MKLRWHCSMTIGITSSPYGDYENECDTDFESECTNEDWEDECASAECPKCHQILFQDYDYPEIVGDRNE